MLSTSFRTDESFYLRCTFIILMFMRPIILIKNNRYIYNYTKGLNTVHRIYIFCCFAQMWIYILFAINFQIIGISKQSIGDIISRPSSCFCLSSLKRKERFCLYLEIITSNLISKNRKNSLHFFLENWNYIHLPWVQNKFSSSCKYFRTFSANTLYHFHVDQVMFLHPKPQY